MYKRQTAQGPDGKDQSPVSSPCAKKSSCGRPQTATTRSSDSQQAQGGLLEADRFEGPAPAQYIVGVDPGLGITGYAVLACSQLHVLEAGVIRGGRGGLADRLRIIYQALYELLAQYKPAELSLEELYSHYDRPRTAILMGHARGVICLAASLLNVPVFSYAATHVKRLITGSGRSPKGQMQQAICRELQLAAPPKPADVADALAIALCHYYTRRRPDVRGAAKQRHQAARSAAEQANASGHGPTPDRQAVATRFGTGRFRANKG